MKQLIRNILANFGIEIYKIVPRYSTIFAKKYFKGDKIKAMEIGVWKGDNAKSLLKELNIEKLYLVDPYQWYNGFERSHGKIYDNIDLDYLYLKTKSRFKDFKNVFLIKEKSSSVIASEIGNDFDFIYIDGNHEYDFIRSDIEKFYSYIKKGGILAGHDFTYSTSKGAVIDAVLDFLKDKKTKLYVMGSDWWIIK